MTIQNEQTIIDSNLEKDYEYGFVTDIESETIPPGLNEDVIRTISKERRAAVALRLAFKSIPPLA